VEIGPQLRELVFNTLADDHAHHSSQPPTTSSIFVNHTFLQTMISSKKTKTELLLLVICYFQILIGILISLRRWSASKPGSALVDRLLIANLAHLLVATSRPHKVYPN
jgi:hypothetical protein